MANTFNHKFSFVYLVNNAKYFVLKHPNGSILTFWISVIKVKEREKA